MNHLVKKNFNTTALKILLLIAWLVLLGFNSCRTKPQTKYGVPTSGFQSRDKLE